MYIYNHFYAIFRLLLWEVQMNRNKTDTYMFPVAPPFDIAYRKENVSHPVGPHTHNAAEVYFTLNDLPDVLLNDTVSAVPAGTVIIIPAFCIHQLYHEPGLTYERYILSINTEWIRSLFCDSSTDYSYLYDNTTPILFFPDKRQKKELIRCLNGSLNISDRTTPEALILFLQLFKLIHSAVLSIGTPGKSRLPVSSAQQKVNRMIAYLQEHIHETTFSANSPLGKICPEKVSSSEIVLCITIKAKPEDRTATAFSSFAIPKATAKANNKGKLSNTALPTVLMSKNT